MAYEHVKRCTLFFKEIQIKTTGYHFSSSGSQKVKGLVVSTGSDVCLYCQWEYKLMYSHLGKQFGVVTTKITNMQILLTPQFHFLESVPKKLSHVCRRWHL